MKKQFKKLLSCILMLCIILSALMPTCTRVSVDAKAKTKLSVKTITMTIGDTKTIKLLNSKKGAIWSSENTNIKIVSETSKKVKIKAIEEGESKVYALVGKKEYECNVIIKYKNNSIMPDATTKPKPLPTSTSKPQNEEYLADFNILEQEVYNGNGVSVRVGNTTKDSKGVNVEFICINNSNKDYSISAHEYAINELMAGGNVYGSDADVPAGKKSKFSISVNYEWFKNNNIKQFKKLDIMFWAYYDNFKEWESEKITIFTNKDNGTGYYIPSGSKIYSDDNIELNYISNNRNIYKFCLKNKTQLERRWILDNCSINDWAYDLGSCKYDLYSNPILDRCYAVFELVIDDDFLTANSISEISSIEFDLEYEFDDIKSDKIKLNIKDGMVYTSTTPKPTAAPTSLPSQTTTPSTTRKPIATSIPKPTITPAPIIVSTNKTIYQDENVKIDYCGIKEDYDSYKFELIIENFTNRTIEVQTREMSINGFMVKPICSIEIAPYKKAQDSIKILGDDAERFPVSTINSVETKFHIFEWGDYKFRYDTENIIIK